MGIIYKLDNTIDPPMKCKIVEVDKFVIKNKIQKINLVKTRPQDLKLNIKWIESFDNLTPIKRQSIMK